MRKRELWRTVKRFLWYLVLSQGLGILGAVIYFMVMHPSQMNNEAAIDRFFESDVMVWAMIAGYIASIAWFLGRGHIRLTMGRLRHCNLWATAGMSEMIALAWLFTELSLLSLIDADKIFADEIEEMEKMDELFKGIRGFLAIAILTPISEEIGFRGMLLGGLLRARVRPWVAIVCSAVVFGILHGTEIQLMGTIVFGIITGWLLWRTRSLLPGMIMHLTNNSFVFITDYLWGDDDENPATWILIVILAVCIPLLVYGLKWFHKRW
jgi:membrane protease YdiL (CAAX protease family)